MLIKLTDTKGIEIWVNPVHVRAVRRKGRHTEVFVPYNPTWGTASVKVDAPLDEVAELINSGMPDMIAYPPVDDSGGGSSGAASAAALAG